MYNIEFINTVAPSVTYDEDSQQEFEITYDLTEGDDIGGLMVYTDGGVVRAVYDYENYTGWIVE